MKLFISGMIKLGAVVLTTMLLPGVTTRGVWPLVWLVIILVPIDYVLKPILQILALPISILTLGLFALVINGVLVLLAAQLVPGFAVDGLLTAIFFSVILSLISTILYRTFDGQNSKLPSH